MGWVDFARACGLAVTLTTGPKKIDPVFYFSLRLSLDLAEVLFHHQGMLQHFRASSTGKLLLLAVVIGPLSFKPSAQARVYATAVQINGAFTNITAPQGTAFTISYILNEPATAGAAVRILSGSTAVRTLTFADGSMGALRGLNTVSWDGLNDAANTVPACTYTVSVTAAATGSSSWTHFITD